MKKLILLLLFVPCLAFAQKQFVIKGRIKNTKYPAKIFLDYKDNGERSHWDSVIVKNGGFEFKGFIADTVIGTLYADPKGKSLDDIWGKSNVDTRELYIAPGTTILTGNNSVKDAKATGSALNADLYIYNLFLYFHLKHERQTSINKKFINVHPDSYVSLDFALRDIARQSFDPDTMQALFNMLSPAIRATAEGVAFQNRINAFKNTVVGASAPEIILPDTNGNSVKLSSLRGKYVLIDFWASWCHPCRAEHPAMVKLYNQYKDRNFTMLGISLDYPGMHNAWLNAIHKDGLTWPQLSDLKSWKSHAALRYSINFIPQCFLIGPDGTIIARAPDMDELEKKLAELLDKKDE